MAGAVSLGNPYLPVVCGDAAKQNLRRINVTFFNDGSATATFTVNVWPVGGAPTPVVTQSYEVVAKSIAQVNGLEVPLPTVPDPQYMGADGVQVWVNVTADQPFLAYVSTIFDDPQPGALPFQVYPARLTN